MPRFGVKRWCMQFDGSVKLSKKSIYLTALFCLLVAACRSASSLVPRNRFLDFSAAMSSQRLQNAATFIVCENRTVSFNCC